jgi:hypothetical protein
MYGVHGPSRAHADNLFEMRQIPVAAYEKLASLGIGTTFKHGEVKGIGIEIEALCHRLRGEVELYVEMWAAREIVKDSALGYIQLTWDLEKQLNELGKLKRSIDFKIEKKQAANDRSASIKSGKYLYVLAAKAFAICLIAGLMIGVAESRRFYISLPGGGIASHRVTTGEVALLLFLMACVYHSLKTGLRVYRNLTGGFDRWTDMPKLKKSSSMVLAVAVSALLIFVAWCGVTTVAKLL